MYNYHTDNLTCSPLDSHPITLATFDLRSTRSFGSKSIHLVSGGIDK